MCSSADTLFTLQRSFDSFSEAACLYVMLRDNSRSSRGFRMQHQLLLFALMPLACAAISSSKSFGFLWANGNFAN